MGSSKIGIAIIFWAKIVWLKPADMLPWKEAVVTLQRMSQSQAITTYARQFIPLFILGMELKNTTNSNCMSNKQRSQITFQWLMLCEHIDKISKPSLINDWLAHQGLNVKLSPSLRDKGDFCVYVWPFLHLPKWNTRWMSEIRKSVESQLLEATFLTWVSQPLNTCSCRASMWQGPGETWLAHKGHGGTEWQPGCTALSTFHTLPPSPGRNDVRNLYQKLSQEVILMKLMSKI